jgi:hypothetical protein
METWSERWPKAAAIAALLGVIAVIGLVFTGGQVSTILSTVGSSIGGTRSGDAIGTQPGALDQAPADASSSTDGQPPAPGKGGGNGAPLPDTRRIVYTGSLDLVVDDVTTATERARAAVLALGGYIGASQERNDAKGAVATITYRIPAPRWDETVLTLRGLAVKVVGGQTQAVEVGDQIVDLEARLRNLRASEQVLVGIAEGTGKVSDLLEVQARLSDVRGEIERIDAQRAQLEDQVSYGTLVATFGVEVVQIRQAARGWDPADDVDRATASLVRAGQKAVSAAIWFGIVWLPLLVLIAVAVTVVVVVGHRLARRFVPAAAAGSIDFGPEG